MPKLSSILVPLLLSSLFFSTNARAAGEDVSTVVTDQNFEEAVESVQSAIANRGFKVDYNGRIGEMLDRTAEDVGATQRVYENAEIFTFCSAVVSRDVMEHDASDIAYCPYVVFVYELDESRKKLGDEVTIGFRHLPEGGARDQVNTLLTEIIESAADGF